MPPAVAYIPRPPANVEQVDTWRQYEGAIVDVLWVFDTSGSMKPYRDAVTLAFPTFLEPFEDTRSDFHVGVITTNMYHDEGKLEEVDGRRWLDRDTPNLVASFTRLIANAESGPTSSTERGLDAVGAALSGTSGAASWNQGFLRRVNLAWLHVIVLTDENDESEDVDPDQLVSFLRRMRPSGRVTFNSIVSLETRDFSERGERYLDVSEELGGFVAGISDDNSWDELLSELGGVLAHDPSHEFFLSRLPVPEAIEVQATDEEGITFVYALGSDVTYDETRNSIWFEEPPPLGAEVRIRYVVRSATVSESQEG